MGKRGLSDIITTILIILIALATIVLVWNFVRYTLEASGGRITLDSLSNNLAIVENSVVVDSSNNVSFNVKRNEGTANIIGFYVTLEDYNGNVVTIRRNQTFSELESKRVFIPFYEHNLNAVKKISLYTIALTGNGKEASSSFPNEYNVGGSTGTITGQASNSVVRGFASPINTGTQMTVSLSVKVSPGVVNYAIEEVVPSGGNVLWVGGNGILNGGKIKWGPFCSAFPECLPLQSDITVSYNVSFATSGAKTFSGNFSYDGNLRDVTGNNQLIVN